MLSRLAPVVLFALVLAACPGSPSTDAATDGTFDADARTNLDAMDSPADVADVQDSAPPDANPSKGPWVVRTDTTHATIRWESRAEPPSVVVSLAPETGGTMQTAMGTSTATVVTASYGVGNRLVPIADFPGTYYMNEVALDGLTPATCYRYQLPSDPMAMGRFCTMHDATDHSTMIRFLVIGDTNPVLMHTIPVLQHTLPENPEFTVHLGDLQYYSSVFESWQYWFELMVPLVQQGAIFPAIGNHENELSGTEFADYYSRFWANPQFDGDTYRYHYQTGGVNFFSLDTEEDLSMGSPQWTWLSNELDTVEASTGYRFSILYFHRPAYTLGDTTPDFTVRAALAPLIASHHIPIVMAGHMHGYERFIVNGITYLTSAGGGGVIGNVNAGVTMYPDDVPYRVASGPIYHAVVVTITSNNLHGDAIDETGVTRDSFDIAVP